MRVIVTGSRTWEEADVVYEALDTLIQDGENLTVVHGAALGGADFWASEWCQQGAPRPAGSRVTEERHPADWDKYGKRAGPIRNQEMVQLGADMVLAFCEWCKKTSCLGRQPMHVTHGTANCVALARAAGIEVVEFW
jgi:hypothetical protein